VRAIQQFVRRSLAEPRHVVASLRLLVFAGLAVLGWSGNPIESSLFWTVTVVYGLTVAGYLVAQNREFDLRRVRVWIFLFDVGVVTVLILLRGRDVQALVMAYFTLVLLAGLMAGVGSAFLSTLVASTLFLVVSGWGRPPADLISLDLLGPVFFFFVIGAFMGHVATDARRREKLPTTRGGAAGAARLRRSTERLRTRRDGLRAEERLRTLGMLCAGIAHEMRTPLSVLCDGAREARDLFETLTGPDESARAEALDELRDVLDDCGHAAWRLQSVATDLNELGRGGSAQVRTVSAHEVVAGAVRLLRGRLDDSVRLHTDVRTAQVVHGDGDRLVHALVILAGNALDALEGREDAILSLSAESDGPGRLVLRVEDNGPGMAPDVVARIYDPFFTTKGPGQGTGLGLYVTREIVRAQDGTIECRSVPGEGTRFRIELPTAAAQDGAEAA
jgi:signal transduction histidine kinase